MKWFLDSTLILTSKHLNTSFFFMVCFILGNVSENLVNLHFFCNCIWVLANPILNFVERNHRSSRGDLTFLTLDLLPSEILQIYKRGKPQSLPTVCSAHSFLELLAPPVGWLSCCLAPSVVLRQWGISSSSPHYVAQCLHVRVSVSHTAEDEKGSRKLEVGTASIVPRWTVLICQSKPSIPGSWHSYDLPQAALMQKKNGI